MTCFSSMSSCWSTAAPLPVPAAVHTCRAIPNPRWTIRRSADRLWVVCKSFGAQITLVTLHSWPSQSGTTGPATAACHVLRSHNLLTNVNRCKVWFAGFISIAERSTTAPNGTLRNRKCRASNVEVPASVLEVEIAFILIAQPSVVALHSGSMLGKGVLYRSSCVMVEGCVN